VVYTRQEVRKEDLKTQKQISGIISWIEGYFDCYSDMDVYDCETFLLLQKNILLLARLFPTAMTVASDMLCGLKFMRMIPFVHFMNLIWTRKNISR